MACGIRSFFTVRGFLLLCQYLHTLTSNRSNGHFVGTVPIGYDWSGIKMILGSGSIKIGFT